MVSNTASSFELVRNTDLTARLTGIYLVIFSAFVRIRLKTTINGSKILLYLVTANFIACTAYLAVDVIANQTVVSSRVILASNALYTCVDFISQLILVNFHTIQSSLFPTS